MLNCHKNLHKKDINIICHERLTANKRHTYQDSAYLFLVYKLVYHGDLKDVDDIITSFLQCTYELGFSIINMVTPNLSISKKLTIQKLNVLSLLYCYHYQQRK